MVGKVLVTGGNGFVAGWCLVDLLQRGLPVRCTVRSASKAEALRAALAPHVDASGLEFAIADLTRDAGWDDALRGCSHVLHVASPLGLQASRDADSLIAPAREGSLRVLHAARRAGVERVVMTSAAAAARIQRGGDWVSDESAWPDPTIQQDIYRRSKVLAERAAWDDMAKHPGAMALTTILPVAVFGPVLSQEGLGSVQVIQRLLQGRPPAVPRLGFSIVDVRDLAALHVQALFSPQAAGERFVAAGEFLWMKDMAEVLRQHLGGAGAKVPTRAMPDWIFKAMALALPPLRMLAGDLGRRYAPSADKARRLLDFRPRPAVTTVLDCARSLALHPPGNTRPDDAGKQPGGASVPTQHSS